MTVGEYDRERGGFALAPLSFSLPQFLRVQRVYGTTTADRELPALLPVAAADAPMVLRSLTTMRMAGSGDRPVVFLRTALRLEAPEVTELGHDQIRVTLRGAVTEQAIFADPELQRRLADDAALASPHALARRPGRGLARCRHRKPHRPQHPAHASRSSICTPARAWLPHVPRSRVTSVRGTSLRACIARARSPTIRSRCRMPC